MKSTIWRRFGALLATAGLVGSLLATVVAPGVALGVTGSVVLGPGTYNFNALALNTNDGGTDNAVYEVINLTLQSGAIIECNDSALPAGASACPITIVATGNVVMEAGSAITANQTLGGGDAGDITITVGGDMTMCGPNGGQTGCASPGPAALGALISATRNDSNAPTVVNTVAITVGDASKATGNFYMEGGSTTYGAETGAKIITDSRAGKSGNINVTAGKTYFTEPGSVVQSGFQNGTSTQIGGKIFIVSDCGLTSEGRITSKGPDPGADLIHLESCAVVIRGLVESTGVGHAVPGKNSCNNIDDGLAGEVLRDKPAASTGCIEVWGKVVTIDSTGGWAGELNADIGNNGGAEGTSWIDIFAFAKLTVTDGTGNDFVRDNGANVYLSTYAVHANALIGSDKNPSVITALVKDGPLTASGKAFEVSGTLTGGVGTAGGPDPFDSDTGHFPGPYFVGNGSDGGTIDLEASGDVTLDAGSVNASGDFFGGTPCPSGTGACGNGGHIIVSAWGTGSNLSWTSGSGDVRPNDSAAVPPPTGGDIKLNACGTITLGADFHGEVPLQTNVCDATKPDIPVITVANGGPVFKTDLWALCSSGSSISGMKFNDANANGVKDPGEAGLDGWTIHLFNATGTVHLTAVTAGGGLYTFTNLGAGTYTICEQVLVANPPWQQTFPTAGPGVVACNPAVPADPAADNPTPGPLGYTVDITSSCTAEGCNCAQEVKDKDFGNIQLATKSGIKWNDVLGNHVRDLPGDVPLDGWVIHLFGTAVNGSAVHQTYTTGTGGAPPGGYKFTVLPGTYTVCETLQTNWVQTFPVAGAGIADCDGPPNPDADNLTPGPLGYAVTLVSGQVDSANDFGNNTTTPVCNKPTMTNVMLGMSNGPDLTVQTWLAGDPGSVQWAVDNVTDTTLDGKLVVLVVAHQDGSLGGTANQKVDVWKTYDKPFALFGCSVTLTGGGTGPALWIKDTATSPGWGLINGRDTTIFTMDVHGGNSAVGVQADGTKRYIRNTYGTNDGIGILVNGSWNTVHNGKGEGNTGDGVQVNGHYNLLTDTNAFSNGGNGFTVVGNCNKLLKLDSGDRNKGNGGDGFNVAGYANGLEENDAVANGATASMSAAAAMTGNPYNAALANKLKKNGSNTGASGSDKENLGAEYRLLNGIKNDGGGNKVDGVTLPSAAKFPTGFPATNATKNFLVVGIGE